MTARVGIAGLLLNALLATGCTTPGHVDCDGRLEPINVPVSNPKETSEQAALSTDEERRAP